jgi:hypothetical protein
VNSPSDGFARLDPVEPQVAVRPLDNALSKYSPHGGAPFGIA